MSLTGRSRTTPRRTAPGSVILSVDALARIVAKRLRPARANVRPTRVQPLEGASATVWHFGGEREPVTIVEVREGGRRVAVTGADGRRREFTLRRATAAFIALGEEHSPRLEL
jgi:hypothetical protein